MASLWMPSSNSAAVERRTLLTLSRLHHSATRKLSVPRSGQDSLVHLVHGLNIDRAGFSSLDCHRRTIFEAALKQLSSALSKRNNTSIMVPSGKTSPSSVLAQAGYVYTDFIKKQELLTHQIWFGYWIGPEDADGWGFVEAYLLPS